MDLNDLPVFVAVAEERGFRAAGRRLGVSGSAVSQTIGQLEERLGIAVFERTTRTVRLTEAGRHLYDQVRPLLGELRAIEEEVRDFGEEPTGTLRLNVARDAESVINGPAISGFLHSCPKVRLELVVTAHTSEIVGPGFDAAIGLRESVPAGMIPVPVSEPLRMAVVGSPDYFERHGRPEHPRDLASHTCINFKATPDAAPYHWEFHEDGEWFEVEVPARVVTTEVGLNLDLAVAGMGINIMYEHAVRPLVEAGALEQVLEDYCAPFPGFHLYYPRRRNRSAALQALIDWVRGEVGR